MVLVWYMQRSARFKLSSRILRHKWPCEYDLDLTEIVLGVLGGVPLKLLLLKASVPVLRSACKLLKAIIGSLLIKKLAVNIHARGTERTSL